MGRSAGRKQQILMRMKKWRRANFQKQAQPANPPCPPWLLEATRRSLAWQSRLASAPSVMQQVRPCPALPACSLCGLEFSLLCVRWWVPLHVKIVAGRYMQNLLWLEGCTMFSPFGPFLQDNVHQVPFERYERRGKCNTQEQSRRRSLT